MGQFSHITRCFELGRSDILSALRSPDSTYELCARLSYVSRGGETSEALLRVFSILASGSADWLQGDLRVTLDASGSNSIVTAFQRTGDGRFAELFPPLRYALSLTELRLAVESNPELLGGLELWEAPRGVELGMANAGSLPSIVPRSRAAASGIRPAATQPPPSAIRTNEVRTNERPSSSPARRQTRKVQIPIEALRKLKDG